MHSRKTLLHRNNLIQVALLTIKDLYQPSNGTRQLLYNAAKLNLFSVFNTINIKKNTSDKKYLQSLDAIFKHLENFEKQTQEDKPIWQGILKEFLLETNRILSMRIEVSAENQEIATKLFEYQSLIESTIQKHLNPSFKLPKQLNLSVTYEYHTAYENEYGTSFIGFFKLPVKRFFQQETRAQELQFLESVEQFCNHNRTIKDFDLDLIRLTAANLVSLKISSETFGNGSILGRILKSRLNESGYIAESNTIVNNPLRTFRTYNITIPVHLVKFLNEETRPGNAGRMLNQ